MGFGVVLTKVMLVVLQLAVAVVFVGSFATLATGDFDLQYGDPEFVLPEDFDDVGEILEYGLNVSLAMPISVTIGGYWPITDFQYSFSLVAGAWSYTGGLAPVDIEPGEVVDLSLNEEINYFPSDEDLYDLVALGTTFSFSMSISMGYLENMFQFGAEVSATLLVGPFLDIGIDEDNVTYDGNNLSVPLKIDPIVDQLGSLLQQLAEEQGFDLGDFDLEDLNIEDLLAQLPEDLELPTFGASFTDSDGNVLWSGDATLKVVNGTIVFDIKDLDQAFMEQVLNGDFGDVDMKINIDLSFVDEFGDELPEEMQEIFDILDGMLVLKAPANSLFGVALGG